MARYWLAPVCSERPTIS